MSARLLDGPEVGQLAMRQKELIRGITEDADRLLKITGELLNMSQWSGEDTAEITGC